MNVDDKTIYILHGDNDYPDLPEAPSSELSKKWGCQAFAQEFIELIDQEDWNEVAFGTGLLLSDQGIEQLTYQQSVLLAGKIADKLYSSGDIASQLIEIENYEAIAEKWRDIGLRSGHPDGAYTAYFCNEIVAQKERAMADAVSDGVNDSTRLRSLKIMGYGAAKLVGALEVAGAFETSVTDPRQAAAKLFGIIVALPVVALLAPPGAFVGLSAAAAAGLITVTIAASYAATNLGEWVWSEFIDEPFWNAAEDLEIKDELEAIAALIGTKVGWLAPGEPPPPYTSVPIVSGSVFTTNPKENVVLGNKFSNEITFGHGRTVAFGDEGDDIYRLQTQATGVQTVRDEAGNDLLYFGIVRVGAGDIKKVSEDVYEIDGGYFKLVLVNSHEQSHLLVTSPHYEGSVVLLDWEEGRFGIHLSAEPQQYDYNLTQVGGSLSDSIDSAPQGTVDAGTSHRMEGGMGNDGLSGGYLDDVLYGGSGSDYINGGGGGDYVDAGDGDDYIVNFAGYFTWAESIQNGPGSPEIPIGQHIQSIAAQNQNVVSYGDAWALLRPSSLVGDITNFYHSAEMAVFASSYSTNAEIHPDADDVIIAGAGNDLAYGNSGSDTITGDDGNDVLVGGAGADYIDGGADDDIIHGDRVIGALTYSWHGNATNVTGDDILVGGAGEDKIYGQGGSDSIYGDDGDDLLLGDRNDDSPSSPNLVPEDPGSDIIYGGNGNDFILGNAGSDTLYGGTGDDQIQGDDLATESALHGDDVIDAGEGDDFVWGGGGADIIVGGDGADHISGDYNDSELSVSAHGDDSIEAGDGDDVAYGNGGDDHIDGGAGNDSIYGGTGHDKLLGSLGDDEIVAGDGEDSIWGGSGSDKLWGESGHDYISGGDNNDYIYGGAGDDDLTGDDGDDQVWGGDGDDVIEGGEGLDRISGDGGADRILAGAGNDIVNGGAGHDELRGGEGSDNISGGDGDDVLRGENGNDYLFGDAGEDVLAGGSGDDQLSGGAGNDIFEFFGSIGKDRVIGSGAAGSGFDILHFDSIYAPESFAYSYSGNSLTITIGASGQRVVVDDYFHVNANVGIVIGDSPTITKSDVQRILNVATPGNDILVGNSGNGTIKGGDGDDLIFDSPGNDTLDGERGADTYVLSPGDGNGTGFIRLNNTYLDSINELNDLVRIRGVSADQISFVSIKDKLEVHLITGDKFTLLGFREGNVIVLDDESVLDYSYVSQRYTYKSDTEIFGQWGDDTLSGSSLAESISGGSGNDIISSGQGNDFVSGDRGNDTLIGGAGDDTVFGSYGADVFVYNLGDGFDITDAGLGRMTGDTTGAHLDVVRFGPGISKEDLDITSGMVSIGDLAVMRIGGVHLRIEFSDGSSMGWQEISQDWHIGTSESETISTPNDHDGLLSNSYELALNSTLMGYGGDDILNGGLGVDVIDGGDGNDVIGVNSVGEARIFFTGEFGDDLVQTHMSSYWSSQSYNHKAETITFSDHQRSEVDIWREGHDLVFGVTGTSNRVTVDGYFYALSFGFKPLSKVVFGDGQIVLPTALASIPYNYDSGRHLTIRPDSGYLHGGGGDDYLYGDERDNTLEGGAGDDVIYGGAGNDTIGTTGIMDDYRNGGNDIMIGGEGNDYLIASGSQSQVSRYISMTGGLGNDEFRVDSFANVDFYFSNGDGKDIFTIGLPSSPNVQRSVVFDSSVESASVSLSRSMSGSLVVKYGYQGDDLTISHNFGNGSEPFGSRLTSIKFADGETWGIQDFVERSRIGTAENDELRGFNFDDVIDGFGGNDLINGAGGNDILRGGDGDDHITGNGGDDVIVGGRGNDYLNAGFAGADAFIFGTDFGIDTIRDESTDFNYMHFIDGVLKEQLWFTRTGDFDLRIDVIGTDDSVTVDDWFRWEFNRLGEIRVGYGDSQWSLDSSEVDVLSASMKLIDKPTHFDADDFMSSYDELYSLIQATWSSGSTNLASADSAAARLSLDQHGVAASDVHVLISSMALDGGLRSGTFVPPTDNFKARVELL